MEKWIVKYWPKRQILFWTVYSGFTLTVTSLHCRKFKKMKRMVIFIFCVLHFWKKVKVLVAQLCLTLQPHGISPGKNTGVGSHSLLQQIFPTQGSNPGLWHCRWIGKDYNFRGLHFVMENAWLSFGWTYQISLSWESYVTSLNINVSFFVGQILIEHLLCLRHWTRPAEAWPMQSLTSRDPQYLSVVGTFILPL